MRISSIGIFLFLIASLMGCAVPYYTEDNPPPEAKNPIEEEAWGKLGPSPRQIRPVEQSIDGFVACIGNDIASRAPTQVNEIFQWPIADKTGAPKFLKKAFSEGASDWLPGVTNMMGRENFKVLVLNRGKINADDVSNMLIFSGAWTEYDRVTLSQARALKLKIMGAELRAGGDTSFDFIGLDLTYRTNSSNHYEGHVAVRALVGTTSGNVDLLYEDGGNGIAVSGRYRDVEGLHSTQRALYTYGITQLLARARGVDPLHCARQPNQALSARADLMRQYDKLPLAERHMLAQRWLRHESFFEATITPNWNQAASMALYRFLVSVEQKPTYDLSAPQFVLLAQRAEDRRLNFLTRGRVPVEPVKVERPAFPYNCLGRRIEGFAVVQFDITGAGGVINPFIREASHPCFAEAVSESISKWKYPVHVGVAPYEVTQRNLEQRFEFRFTDL
ncbi:energy transducer TonB [Parvularcula marina]|uniref:Energy transducer TonB n=1 Tax=Parvularcula marina TaxID=2292771 RepID=A0A371R7I4_9PROT|nr:energy transducer TonB [Parvularcula marina]RFB01422.1 energy transducer TonB [Parvularcula marina]